MGQAVRQSHWREIKNDLILASWILVPSLFFLQEHVGVWAIPFYGVIVAGVMVCGWRWMPMSECWLTDRFWWIFVFFLVGLTAAHLLLHPFEDGRGTGLSSDRDEALEVAVGRMLEGNYPYYQQSKVAGPLSVLPGGVMLAAPFVMLGKVGMMNVAWLLAFLAVMRREFGSAKRALWLLAVSLAVSPSALYEFVSGGDLIANGIFVAIACWTCLRFWSRPEFRVWPAVASAAFLGVAVASRANFPLLGILVVAWICRGHGIGRAALCAVVSGAVSIGLVAAFYFWDPETFTPFMSRNKLMVAGAPEWSSQLVLTATLLSVFGFALAALLVRSGPKPSACFRACTWVTLVPILGMILTASVANGRIDISILHDRFGLMWVPFALLGWGKRCSGPSKEECIGDALHPAKPLDGVLHIDGDAGRRGASEVVRVERKGVAPAP